MEGKDNKLDKEERRGKLSALYLARLDRLNKENDLKRNDKKYS